MISQKLNQAGFTLVEIAVVLVIIGMLVGSFIGSITSRIETTRREDTRKQLEEIKTAIFGFASASGRIPCPATTTAIATELGLEQPTGGGVCTFQHGFVPGRTLGLSGSYNRDNLLTDSWGNPIRYSVSNDSAAIWAFTSAPGTGSGMVDIGMNNLLPNLVVCDSDSTNNNICQGGPNTLINDAVFIVLSLGKDGSNFVAATVPNSDQGENASELVVAAYAAGENVAYTVGNNNVFVSKEYSSVDSTAGQFDDLIIWASQYVLYSRMMEAGQLP